MKRIFFTIVIFVLACQVNANEINGEVNISWVKPYEKLVPGFNITIRPELLEFGRFSFGGGVGMHISSRFNYDNSPHWMPIDSANAPSYTDSTEWFYYDEDFIELVNYELNIETRFRAFGNEDERWKGYLTLHAGFIIHASQRTLNQTIAEQLKEDYYNDSLYTTSILNSDLNTYTFKTEFDPSFYFAPGIMIGIDNFFVGYRHWFYFNDRTLAEGKPAETYFTFRVGYRFRW